MAQGYTEGLVVNGDLEHHMVLTVECILFQVPRSAVHDEGEKRRLDEDADIEHVFPSNTIPHPVSVEWIEIPENFIERLKAQKAA